MHDEPVEWLNPREAETWLVLWAVSEWLPARLDQQLKRDSGVSHRDYFALAQISMAPDERLSMTELARLSDMSASHLSHVVSRLEKRGWVRRFPSHEDRRTNIAQLTDEGRNFLREAAPGHVRETRRRIFDHLTGEENRILGALLGKVLEGLDPPGIART